MQVLIAIEGRSKKVSLQSKNKGEAYGMRLLPSEKGVLRKYFIKGSKKLELAHTFVEKGDWESVDFNEKESVQSKAVYNLAFYEEIKGNLGGALFLAKKAYKKHATKTNEKYINILKKRIEESEIVKHQLARTYFLDSF